VQAHPDDADHLCGGTIALLAAEGKAIHYLLVTRGDQGYDDPEMTPERLVTIREQEQRRAAETLGVETVTFLEGYHDGEVEPTIALRRELVLAIRQWKPDTIFTFDPWRRNELHPDHRAISICTVDAVACARTFMYPEQLQNGITPHRVRDLYYFSTDRPDHWVDISSVTAKKIEALRCHDSQTKHKDLHAWVREKGLIAGAEHKLKYAEAFHHHVT
jgi:LmbE family N-acetylglucosaminyl deacetylase